MKNSELNSNVLESAQKGDSKAIAVLINRQLQSKGVNSKASRKDNLLQILLEASDTPDQKVFCPFLEKGIKKISPQGIKTVRIYGKSQSKDTPDWNYSFELSREENAFDFNDFQDKSNEGEKQLSYFEAEGKNGKIRLTQKRVIISREGFWGFVSQGMAGNKEIPIRNITAVQFKPAGKTADWVPLVGYLQFSVLGGVEKQGGVFKAVDDENTVAFNPEQQPNFEEVKRYVDSIIDGEPISLSDLKFIDPATVEIEQPFWNKPIEINKLKSDLLKTTSPSNELSQKPTVAKNISRVLVAISAIFLGFFGIHKFILGYYREGFILLGITLLSMGTLSIFTWLVGLVEGIFYLLKSDRQFQTQYVENKRRWF